MEDKEILALAHDVAAELGDGWTAGTQRDVVGAVLYAFRTRLIIRDIPRKPDHVAVKGMYPDDSAYSFENGERIEINVRADRGAQAIAREIERRVLPGYLTTLGKIRAADAARDKRFAIREAFVGRVYAILGTTPPQRTDDDIRCARLDDGHAEVNLTGMFDGYGEVKVSQTGESGEIRLGGIPAETILDLLRYLREREQ